MSNEDVVPDTYKYYWSQETEAINGVSLTDFITKYKPSMVQNDGTKPWIWVSNSNKSYDKCNPEEEAKSEEEGAQILSELTEEVERIKTDESIPMRSNKKTGAQSKKEVREAKQAEAGETLREIALKYGNLCGKWLIFVGADKVDTIWSGIAKSMISGPLSETCAMTAKVATSPAQELPHHQHVICVYMPNVYDQESVRKVMEVLLRNHGASLSGVKSDLYTCLGIDSKHSSGIQSTVWKNTAIMKDTEIKKLREEFFQNLASGKGHLQPESATVAQAEVPVARAKPQPKLKKKNKNTNPFSSDDEDKESKIDKQKKPKRRSDDEGLEDRPKKKRQL